jgi:hypothetical protein
MVLCDALAEVVTGYLTKARNLGADGRDGAQEQASKDNDGTQSGGMHKPTSL